MQSKGINVTTEQKTGFVRQISGKAYPELQIGGDWLLAHYATIKAQLSNIPSPLTDNTRIDWRYLGALDTAGAVLLSDLIGPQQIQALSQSGTELPAEQLALLLKVAAAMTNIETPSSSSRHSSFTDFLAQIGLVSSKIWQQQIALLGFIGLTIETLMLSLLHPRRWRITSLVAHIEQTGLNAVPIVALLTFLVGAVVAFLGTTVLFDFGASIYTVDLVAFAFLREFGVLLAAILLAGRTASSFTAQIGAMKANEEIDAIRALGLNPVELLVLPRVLAILISLPVLTFIAMVCGIIGGALVCSLELNISPRLFLTILQRDISLTHFLVGISKAPVFAFVIAVIGCLEGFKVSGSAQSVGEHTISSVVQSIFMVILLDALAALFFMEMSW